MKPDLFALVINPQPAVSHGLQQTAVEEPGFLVNLAVVPFPYKPFGKLFNLDYLKTDISLLQSLLEVKF